MGYTVVYEGEPTADVYQDYFTLLSRLLLKHGLQLDRVPRTSDNGHADRWLYVWDREEDAREFAEQVKAQTEDPHWRVSLVEQPPSLGPLRPIQVEVGRAVSSWTFGLDPLTRRALQLRFPGSCENDDVSIGVPFGAKGTPKWQRTTAAVRTLVEQVLPILTGLSVEQLRTFGGFQLVDPVTREIIVPPSGFQPAEGGEAGPSG
jgi:hypothetical protein